MKNLIFAIAAALILVSLVLCTKDADELTASETIAYIKTYTGGCNGLDSTDLKSASEDSDTLLFTIRNDTLNAFIGINYICCTPFSSEAEISNDSIFISLNDTCALPGNTCYCHCMCYYTWEFLFTVSEYKEYYFKVTLNDPREEEPIVFKEGTLLLVDE